MSRFINPFSDDGFKRLFGQEKSKPVLLGFLNALLEGERNIVSLEYGDKEQLGIRNDEDRSAIYDIYCTLEGGDHIIVEMQNRPQPYFKDRSIFYSSYAIAKQGEPGDEWKYDLKAVYTVCFLNFRRRDISTDFRTDVALMDIRHRTIFSDKLRFIYLQLPLFRKEPEECDTLFEKIIYALKDMDILQRRPDLFSGPIFSKIASIADVASMTKKEREQYDTHLRQYRDTIAVLEGQYQEGMADGMEKGMQKGMQKGMEKGRRDTSISNARNMLADGLPVEKVAQYTGLAIEDVRSLTATPS